MKNIFVLLLLLIFGILYAGCLCLKHLGLLKSNHDQEFKRLLSSPLKKEE